MLYKHRPSHPVGEAVGSEDIPKDRRRCLREIVEHAQGAAGAKSEELRASHSMLRAILTMCSLLITSTRLIASWVVGSRTPYSRVCTRPYYRSDQDIACRLLNLNVYVYSKSPRDSVSQSEL